MRVLETALIDADLEPSAKGDAYDSASFPGSGADISGCHDLEALVNFYSSVWLPKETPQRNLSVSSSLEIVLMYSVLINQHTILLPFYFPSLAEMVHSPLLVAIVNEVLGS